MGPADIAGPVGPVVLGLPADLADIGPVDIVDTAQFDVHTDSFAQTDHENFVVHHYDQTCGHRVLFYHPYY